MDSRISENHLHELRCSNPRYILNPLAGEMISRYGFYVLDGREFYVNKKLAYFDTTLRQLKPRLKYTDEVLEGDDAFGVKQLTRKRVCNINDDIVNNSFFVDRKTGECFPMYLKVRCGHCDNCKKSKVMSLVQRCKLESMSSKFDPIFITLTYDEEHKPKEGVCLRDCQLFFKRLRINLQRSGYTDPIRYLLVAEYGTKTSRPHYHAILWNLHQSNMVSYKSIGEILKKSWNNGFEMHRLVDMRDDNAFFYTSKYLGKDSRVPPGQNKTFMVCSNRGGAIGSLFLATLAPELRKTLNTSPKFNNPFTGKVEELHVDRFVLDKIFPTISRSLTSPVRSAVKRFVCNVAALRTYENFDNTLRNLSGFDLSLEHVIDYFSRYMYIYRPDTVSLAYLKPYNQLLRELDEDMVKLESFMRLRGFYFDPVDLDHRRHLYIDNLLRKQVPKVDLETRAREWRRLCDYYQQLEIF